MSSPNDLSFHPKQVSSTLKFKIKVGGDQYQNLFSELERLVVTGVDVLSQPLSRWSIPSL